VTDRSGDDRPCEPVGRWPGDEDPPDRVEVDGDRRHFPSAFDRGLIGERVVSERDGIGVVPTDADPEHDRAGRAFVGRVGDGPRLLDDHSGRTDLENRADPKRRP
jgi:hypothetical protein